MAVLCSYYKGETMIDPRNSSPVQLPSTNVLSTMDETMSYSSKVDVQLSQQAATFKASEYIDWDDEFNMENDYE